MMSEIGTIIILVNNINPFKTEEEEKVREDNKILQMGKGEGKIRPCRGVYVGFSN